jgi:hypothetical protein
MRRAKGSGTCRTPLGCGDMTDSIDPGTVKESLPTVPTH